MKVLILPNFNKSGGIDCAKRAVDKLNELELVPMFGRSAAGKIGISNDERGCVVAPFELLLRECDIILTIGGDGTILHSVQHALRYGKPLLGINTGRIGFLTQIEADELEGLEVLRKGSYTILDRMMLEVTLVQDDRQETFMALNEAVISRGESERVVEIAVTCAGKPVALHRADGLMFATPTGSTAYNLAAGGPVCDPGLNLILMTAISPHSHFHQTMILSPGQIYEAREKPSDNKRGLIFSIDGRRAGALGQGGHIRVRSSEVRARFIDLGLRDFYRRVDVKLRVGK